MRLGGLIHIGASLDPALQVGHGGVPNCHCIYRHRTISRRRRCRLWDRLATESSDLWQHHPILNFKLQRAYSSLGRLDLSLSLFRLTPDPNVLFWTAIIHGHALHGLHGPALLLYSQMLSSGVEPNAFTFSTTLKACSLNPGRALHSQAVRLGLDADPYVGTATLDMYARGGEVVSARKLFDKMPTKNLISLTAMITCHVRQGELDKARELIDEMDHRDSVCWNSMLDGYTQHDRSNDSLALFRQMLRSSSVVPDKVTVLSVLSACAQIGALDSGRWVHSYIESNGIRFNAQLGTALIDMYCKCGSLEDACGQRDSMSLDPHSTMLKSSSLKIHAER